MSARRWMFGLWLILTACWFGAFVGFIPLYVCFYEWSSCAWLTLLPPVLLGLVLLLSAWVGPRLFRR